MRYGQVLEVVQHGVGAASENPDRIRKSWHSRGHPEIQAGLPRARWHWEQPMPIFHANYFWFAWGPLKPDTEIYQAVV